ncbi:MAG: aspartyl protease family protein [Bacteroidota bacterium]
MKLFNLLFCGILCFWWPFGGSQLLAQPGGIQLKRNKVIGEIPFEQFQNLIILNVQINDKLPIRLILDTGAQYTIITDRQIMDIMEVHYDRDIKIYGSDRTRILHAKLATQVALDLPSVRFNNQAVLVLDEDYLNLTNIIGTTVHGIMGTDLFKRFVVKIDYYKSKIILYEPEAFKAPDAEFTRVPLNIINGKPYVRLPLTLEAGNQVEPVLLVDSGASLSFVIHPNTYEEINIPDHIVNGNIGYGLGGEVRGFMGRIDELRFPPFEFKNLVTNFQDLPNFGDTLSVEPRQGFVGGEILQRFTVIFDFVENQMYLKPNKRFKTRFKPDLSGIILYAIGQELNDFLVADVLLSSPAYRAGVRVNDQIYKVNGRSAASFTVQSLGKLFSSKSGKRITLTIGRRGHKYKIKFRLTEYI